MAEDEKPALPKPVSTSPKPEHHRAPKSQAEKQTEPEAPKAAPGTRAASAYPDSTHLVEAKGMYGQPRHVVAGALHLLRAEIGADSGPFTKADVAGAVQKFLNHEIDGDQA